MRIETLDCDLTSSHWGAYEVGRHNGKVVELRSWAQDPEPSPIGLAMLDAYRSPLRIQRPAVRGGRGRTGLRPWKYPGIARSTSWPVN